MEAFDFCPNSLVPVTITPEPGSAISMNGWEFTSRPAVPFRRKFQVTLYGLRWFLDSEGRFYDHTTERQNNARALELFYEEHQTWKSFNWEHPHLGVLTVRFSEKVDVPAGEPNSQGLIEKLEVNFIEHNPGFRPL